MQVLGRYKIGHRDHQQHLCLQNITNGKLCRKDEKDRESPSLKSGCFRHQDP